MLEVIKNWFLKILHSLDSFLGGIFKIDQHVLTFYNDYIVPLPEIAKILGAVFLAIILVFGVIAFVKKTLKLFLILAIILVIVFVLTRL